MLSSATTAAPLPALIPLQVLAAAIPLLAEVSKVHRDALVMVAVRGHTYENAAALLNLRNKKAPHLYSVGTVKSRAHRARRELTKLLDSGAEPDLSKIESWRHEPCIATPTNSDMELKYGYAVLFELAHGKRKDEALRRRCCGSSLKGRGACKCAACPTTSAN